MGAALFPTMVLPSLPLVSQEQAQLRTAVCRAGLTVAIWGKQEWEASWPGLSAPQFHLWDPILHQGSGFAGAALRRESPVVITRLSLRPRHEHLAAWKPDPRAESQELSSWEGQGRGCGAHLEPSHCCLDTNSFHFPHQPSSHSNHWLVVS